MKLLSRVRPSATPWTAAHQAPPSVGFSRQEYWSGVPLPSPGDVTNGKQIQNMDSVRGKLGRHHESLSTDLAWMELWQNHCKCS